MRNRLRGFNAESENRQSVSGERATSPKTRGSSRWPSSRLACDGSFAALPLDVVPLDAVPLDVEVG